MNCIYDLDLIERMKDYFLFVCFSDIYGIYNDFCWIDYY